jgi:phosphohistidine phosphatase
MASKQLFVLRHAKSSWDDPGLDDRERPLAPRGRRAVKVLAGHVRDGGIRPGQILCSPARRTRETLEGVAPGGEALIESELYSASASELIERLHNVPEEVESVMVIGHNPAMQTLVLRLAGGNGVVAEGSNLADVKRKFPTGALATLSFECPWSELSPGRAALTALVRPKDLH